jgi:hypothetical protein
VQSTPYRAGSSSELLGVETCEDGLAGAADAQGMSILWFHPFPWPRVGRALPRGDGVLAAGAFSAVNARCALENMEGDPAVGELAEHGGDGRLFQPASEWQAGFEAFEGGGEGFAVGERFGG